MLLLLLLHYFLLIAEDLKIKEVLKMANIKLVKLITGEDIITKYESLSETSVKFTNSVQISMVPTRAGSTNFGFLPYPMYSEEKELIMCLDHIIYVVDPAQDFLEQYNQLFGEIITPNKSSIIL